MAEAEDRRPAARANSDLRARTVDAYVHAFEAFDRTVAAHQPTWLTELRRAAITRFADLGFPTTAQEAWRFTSVARVAERPAALAPPATVGAEVLADLPLSTGVVVALVNGRLAPELCSTEDLPDGVRLSSLREALEADSGEVERALTRATAPDSSPFVALNTAFIDDGVFLSIPSGTVVEPVIHVVCLSVQPPASADIFVSHPRILVCAGEQSQARFVETYASHPGDGASSPELYVTNAVTEVDLAPHAVLDHYTWQEERAGACHFGSLFVSARRDATFSSHSLALGGSLVRNDVVAHLGGEGVECTLNGLYLAGGQTLVDNHTTIDHAMPHCNSHELYNGVLWDRAHAVFNGAIIVRPDAQKTDAKQSNKALLLSDRAQVNTKPELEIFADDVKCTHGAAIGQLDEDAIFYLRSRGLGPREARAMLIHAFAGDIVHRIQIPELRERLEITLTRLLPTTSSEEVG